MKRIASSSNADTIVLRAIYEVEKVERATRRLCFSARHALSWWYNYLYSFCTIELLRFQPFGWKNLYRMRNFDFTGEKKDSD